jgi:secreted PhoX family phosphatase
MKNYAAHDSSENSIEPIVNRRDVMKGGFASTAALSLGTLASHKALAFGNDYGPLAPVVDGTTGLPLIELPAGFKYWTYGWAGSRMTDGIATPRRHDGMAVVAVKGNQLALVRNHEINGLVPAAIPAPATYDPRAAGGCSTLLFDAFTGKWQASYMSLSGTQNNCAGGLTPWGSWLTCEETTTTTNGVPHGFVFEVPGFGTAKPLPIKQMGRFSHEATATDPVTGYVYETEDATPSGFFRYRPNTYGKLLDGGVLEMLKVKGAHNFNFSGINNVYPSFAHGTTWEVEWVPVPNPEQTGCYARGAANGGAGFARLEGCWYDSGIVHFLSTSGGPARKGQVFEYDPRRETLTLILEAGAGSEEPNGIDNLTVSPRGGVILCEDGGHDPQRMLGMNSAGEYFEFARNAIQLNAGDIASLEAQFPGIASVLSPGSYTGEEWCGACFHDRWLFVNIQTPGITFAITGPWNESIL